MGSIQQFIDKFEYQQELITVQGILELLQPKFRQHGWLIEYEFKDELHFFYTHPIDIPKEAHNIRTASILTFKVVQYFLNELIDLTYK